jgi:hypothetical protein
VLYSYFKLKMNLIENIENEYTTPSALCKSLITKRSE